MRPYWKAYYLQYWQVRGDLRSGIADTALADFLAKPYHDSEAKADLIRLSQQLKSTAQAA
jgi:hypothetical protein